MLRLSFGIAALAALSTGCRGPCAGPGPFPVGPTPEPAPAVWEIPLGPAGSFAPPLQVEVVDGRPVVALADPARERLRRHAQYLGGGDDRVGRSPVGFRLRLWGRVIDRWPAVAGERRLSPFRRYLHVRDYTASLPQDYLLLDPIFGVVDETVAVQVGAVEAPSTLVGVAIETTRIVSWQSTPVPMQDVEPRSLPPMSLPAVRLERLFLPRLDVATSVEVDLGAGLVLLCEEVEE